MGTKVVFFDVDDTLYDHGYHIHQAISALREEYSFLQEYSVEYLKGLSHQFLEEVHERLLHGEISVEESREIRWQKFLDTVKEKNMDAITLANFYSKSYYNAERAVPGAIELLRSLKQGYKIGVISNNLFAEQLSKMKRIGVSEHIDIFAISEEVGAAKPEPLIFEIALKRGGVNAEEAVLIGDSWNNDVLGAMNAGIRPIWFNRTDSISLDDSIAEINSFIPIESVIDHIRSDNATPHITRPEPARL
jgi:HAD superfamily hydrolase (TIGR01549 family)